MFRRKSTLCLLMIWHQQVPDHQQRQYLQYTIHIYTTPVSWGLTLFIFLPYTHTPPLLHVPHQPDDWHTQIPGKINHHNYYQHMKLRLAYDLHAHNLYCNIIRIHMWMLVLMKTNLMGYMDYWVYDEMLFSISKSAYFDVGCIWAVSVILLYVCIHNTIMITHLKFSICVRCDMAIIEPMHMISPIFLKKKLLKFTVSFIS